MRNSGEAELLGLMLPHEGAKQVTSVLAASLRQGWTGPSNGVRVGTGPRVCWRGGLGGLPTPLVMLCAGGVCSFCILFLICPNWACMKLFLVLYSFFFFFVFCCSKRCLFRHKHYSSGVGLVWGDKLLSIFVSFFFSFSCHFDFKETTERNITQWKKYLAIKHIMPYSKLTAKCFPIKKWKRNLCHVIIPQQASSCSIKTMHVSNHQFPFYVWACLDPDIWKLHIGETLRSSDDGEVELWWFFSLFSMIKSA